MLAYLSRALAASALREVEGLRLKPYRDTGGVLTVGYGHTGADVRSITRGEAEALLMADIAKTDAGIDWRGLEGLASHQRAAVLVFAFNVGAAAFNRSGLRVAIRRGLSEGRPMNPEVVGEWMRWRYVHGIESKGLILRRARELEIFRGVGQMQKIKATIINYILERLSERSTAAGIAALAVSLGVQVAPDVATFLATVAGALLVIIKTRVNP